MVIDLIGLIISVVATAGTFLGIYISWSQNRKSKSEDKSKEDKINIVIDNSISNNKSFNKEKNKNDAEHNLPLIENIINQSKIDLISMNKYKKVSLGASAFFTIVQIVAYQIDGTAMPANGYIHTMISASGNYFIYGALLSFFTIWAITFIMLSFSIDYIYDRKLKQTLSLTGASKDRSIMQKIRERIYSDNEINKNMLYPFKTVVRVMNNLDIEKHNEKERVLDIEEEKKRYRRYHGIFKYSKTAQSIIPLIIINFIYIFLVSSTTNANSTFRDVSIRPQHVAPAPRPNLHKENKIGCDANFYGYKGELRKVKSTRIEYYSGYNGMVDNSQNFIICRNVQKQRIKVILNGDAGTISIDRVRPIEDQSKFLHTATINTDGTNIRSSPVGNKHTKSNIIRKMGKGEVVEVYKIFDVWQLVMTKNKEQGFVHSSLIDW